MIAMLAVVLCLAALPAGMRWPIGGAGALAVAVWIFLGDRADPPAPFNRRVLPLLIWFALFLAAAMSGQ